MVKNPPAQQETRGPSLSQEDPLEDEMATHSSILAGKSHGQRSLAGFRGVIKSQTRLSTQAHTQEERKKQPGTEVEL